MPNTHIKIYIHAVFGVKYRNALIAKNWRSTLFSVIGNLINETGCKNIIVNGVEDHVHCLFELNSNVKISEVLKAIKAKSSKFVNENQLIDERFEWQKGYGAFSYSHFDLNQAIDYINNQEEHNKKNDFHDEIKQLLFDNNLTYEPVYSFEDLI